MSCKFAADAVIRCRVDLPNQLRIVRVGDNYRIVVGGSLVDDVPPIAIVRLEPGRYYVLSEVGQGY
jgi:hypothetical protein